MAATAAPAHRSPLLLVALPFVLLLVTGVQCGPVLSIDTPAPKVLVDEAPVAVSGTRKRGRD